MSADVQDSKNTQFHQFLINMLSICFFPYIMGCGTESQYNIASTLEELQRSKNYLFLGHEHRKQPYLSRIRTSDSRIVDKIACLLTTGPVFVIS